MLLKDEIKSIRQKIRKLQEELEILLECQREESEAEDG